MIRHACVPGFACVCGFYCVCIRGLTVLVRLLLAKHSSVECVVFAGKDHSWTNYIFGSCLLGIDHYHYNRIWGCYAYQKC